MKSHTYVRQYCVEYFNTITQVARMLQGGIDFYARQLYRQVLLRARISYGNSLRLSVRPSSCHDPVPNQAQVR